MSDLPPSYSFANRQVRLLSRKTDLGHLDLLTCLECCVLLLCTEECYMQIDRSCKPLSVHANNISHHCFPNLSRPLISQGHRAIPTNRASPLRCRRTRAARCAGRGRIWLCPLRTQQRVATLVSFGLSRRLSSSNHGAPTWRKHRDDNLPSSAEGTTRSKHERATDSPWACSLSSGAWAPLRTCWQARNVRLS